MWSRREFIFSTLSGLSLWANLSQDAVALSRRQRIFSRHSEPNLVVGEYWSPAIAGDFIGVFDGDLCCILDEFGRLVTANILPTALRSRVFPILGRVDNLGSKVFDFQVLPRLAVALVWNQTGGPVDNPIAEQNRRGGASPARLHRRARVHKPINATETGEETAPQEGQFGLTVVNLSSATAPHIVSTISLPDYSELHTFALDRSFICLGGIDANGKDKVSIYRFKDGRKPQLEILSSFRASAPIKDIVMAEKNLLIMHDTPTCKVSLVDLSNVWHPQIVRTVEVPGEDNQLICYGNHFALSQSEESSCAVKIGEVKAFPEALCTTHVDALQSIDSMAMNEQILMVLGNSKDESAVIPFAIDSNHRLSERKKIGLGRQIDSEEMADKLVLGKNNAFVSSGWDGVQVLSVSRSGAWSASARFSVPKLPVAGLVAWSNYLILAGTDLRLYDLSRPEQPKLLNVSILPSTLKEMVLAGSYILCLDKNGVTLRKAEDPQEILANLKISAKQLSFDMQTKKAYLIKDADKRDNDQHQSTQLLQVNVYSNNIEPGKLFNIADEAYCSSAYAGYVLIGSLNGLSLYKPDQDVELICKREFKDLAWREIILRDENIFATAVDHNANGFFLTMSFNGEEINLLESIKIPHDGVSLAVKEKRAFTVGQDINGRNLLATIDLSDPASPKIVSVKSVLESASSVTLTDNLAIVSGRGFEIFSFSS